MKQAVEGRYCAVHGKEALRRPEESAARRLAEESSAEAERKLEESLSRARGGFRCLGS